VSGNPDNPEAIFLSYRRDDAKANAGRISDHLKIEFGKESVFIDIDMPPGVDFPAYLESHISNCQVVLVIIGKKWASSFSEIQKSQNPNRRDHLITEIEFGLKRDIVIPVLVDDAKMPIRESLPRSIQKIVDKQAHTISPEGNFKRDMQELINLLTDNYGIGSSSQTVPPVLGTVTPVLKSTQNPSETMFCNALEIVMEDGSVTPEERHLLKVKMADLGISVSRGKELERIVEKRLGIKVVEKGNVQQKSMALAIVLCFFCGPFGMIYASPKRWWLGLGLGVVMFMMPALGAALGGTKGEPGYDAAVDGAALVSFLLLWLTGIIYSVILVTKHNEKSLR